MELPEDDIIKNYGKTVDIVIGNCYLNRNGLVYHVDITYLNEKRNLAKFQGKNEL